MIFNLFLPVVLFFATPVLGAHPGDESYGNYGGTFWAFGSYGVNIIDPVTGTVVKNIPDSTSTGNWGDAVFMRDQAQMKHYAFIADRDDDKMWVFDTTSQSLISKVDIGDSPVHIYAYPGKDEVWAHLDQGDGYDVFHMSDVKYRRAANVSPDSATTGHGKILIDPNLEEIAFATNVREGIVTKLSTNSRQLLSTTYLTQAANATGVDYVCGGTHGITYNVINNRLYIECSNPRSCAAPYESSDCTGSIWTVDATTLEFQEKLESPLSPAITKGVFGQPYSSPDEKYIMVPNGKNNILSILKPGAPIVDEETASVTTPATLVKDVPVNFSPGAVVWIPKDKTTAFGMDSDPANYHVAIAQQGTDPSAGIAFIDMAVVTQAFETNTDIPVNAVSYIKVGSATKYRALERGGEYLATSSGYDSTSGKYSQVAVVHVDTKEVTNIAMEGTARILFVPLISDDTKAKITQLQAKTDSLEVQNVELQDTVDKQDDTHDDGYNTALAIGAVALVFSLVNMLMIGCVVMWVKSDSAKHAAGGILGGQQHDSLAKSDEESSERM